MASRERTLGTALAYAVVLALAVWGFADVPSAYLNPTVAIAPRRAGRLRLA